MNLKHLVGAAAVAAVATVGGLAAAGGVAPARATTPPDSSPPSSGATIADRSIVVNGHGSITVAPDTATISMGVQTTAATSQEAMDTLSTKSNDLVTALTGAGVAADDIATSGLSLWPTYDQNGERITGYQASTNVTVTIRDLTRAGELIDTAAGLVGNEFTLGGISFSHSDPESVLVEARTQAIQNAHTRAEQYAAAAGVSVGEIVRIIEPSASTVVPIDARVSAEDAAAGSVAIQPGTLDLTVDVTVVYAMS